MNINDRIVRRRELEQLVGATERAIRDWEKAGHFPQRFQLSPGGRAVGWRLSEVLGWLDQRAGSRAA